MLSVPPRHSSSSQGKRASPTASLSSVGSSSSTKEQRQQELQALQRRQFKLQQQRQQRQQHIGHVSSTNPHGTRSLGEQQRDAALWTSQESNAWVNVEDVDGAQWESHPSHVSDGNMDIGSTKLLSDETPPDMDGSWGQDDSEDDSPYIPGTRPSNEHHNNDNTTSHNNDIKKNKDTHGYDHMGTNEKATAALPSHRGRSKLLQNLEGEGDRPLSLPSRNTAQDSNKRSRDTGSSTSAHVKRTLTLAPKENKENKENNDPNRPWRGADPGAIINELTQKEKSRNHVALTATTRQASKDRDDHQDGYSSEDSNATVDSLPLVHRGKGSKSEQMKQGKLTIDPPAVSASAKAFQSNRQAFQQQRLKRSNKAGIDINVHDHHSSDEKADAPTTAPTKSPSNIPTPSTSRNSHGTRHHAQSSRDTEIGDRGSTTSRDSAYRDSLSGSTLGSAGFNAQLEGMNKIELIHKVATAILDAESDPKKGTTRVLPYDVNVGSKLTEQEEVRTVQGTNVMSSDDDSDITPPSKSRTSIPSPRSTKNTQLRRTHPEKDSNTAKKLAALATKGLAKQTSSFVEELANATAHKSAAGSSSKKASKNPEPEPVVDTKVSSRRRRDKGKAVDDGRHAREKREVTFKNSSDIDMEEEEEEEEDSDAVMDDDAVSLMSGSRALSAFKKLKSLDISIDVASLVHGDDDGTSSVGFDLSRGAQSDDDDIGPHLSAALRSPRSPKTKRKGEYSLKWEDQLETASNASARSPGFHAANTSRSSSRAFNDTFDRMSEQPSFSCVETRVMELVTECYPFADWDTVKELDLSKKEVDSLITLNERLPNLEVLNVNDNLICHLSGVPKRVKTLHVQSNLLDELTNFNHLKNLQYLDFSHNHVQDLSGLSSLIHLRELIAENNKITSIAELHQMDSLIRLDLSHNCLTGFDFQWTRLQRLEYLNCSHNRIERVDNIESLTGLIHFNLAHNRIEDIHLIQPLRRVRILRLSVNRLYTFDATPFPGLRTLYLDDNRLHTLENCQKLTRLENFSARDQEGEGIAIEMAEFINSRKLYLSGNPIHELYHLEFKMEFYRLEYLEICAGCLTMLPDDFAARFPNLRGLNLSYNEQLDNISALVGLRRLRRLILVRNDIKDSRHVWNTLEQLPSLVALDLRHNPLTSNIYPAMSMRQGSKYHQETYKTNQSSKTENDWRRRDADFRLALPNKIYKKRSLYRSMIILKCRRLEWFDGDEIKLEERKNIPVVMDRVLQENEEEDEDLEYEDGYYHDGFMDQQQMQGWDMEQQWNQYRDDGEDVDFDPDERDPEDITDNSKRPCSSFDSGSVGSQRHLMRHQNVFAPQQQQQQQARRLRPDLMPQVPSPSPKGPVPSKTSSNTASTGRGRKGSVAHAQHPMQQQQQQQQQQDEEGENGWYDGTQDKRSAIQTWVNEHSHPQLQLPKISPMMGPAITTIASDRERRARAQQHYRSRGSSVGSQGGGSVGSPRSPRNGKEISITAIANNSGDEELIRKSQRRRASSGANRKPNILALPFFQQPQPQPQVQQQQQAQQQPQQNRLSVQSIQSLQSARSRARSESTSAVMSPYQASRLARPQSQLMFGPGYERADLGTGTASPLLRVQQQSSPMSPGTMTASGTVLKQGRDRRRSISVYPNSSANTRRKELLGNAQTSPDETPHYVLVGGNASSGYFGTSHHGAQSPFGFARGPTMASSSAAIGASRSCVNTPSRNGRLSRISVGAGQPQTLAREMEQRQPPQHAGFKA